MDHHHQHVKIQSLPYNTFDFNADLETLGEERDGVQDCEAHFSGDIALQQRLVHDICFGGACICGWKADQEERVFSTPASTVSKC